MDHSKPGFWLSTLDEAAAISASVEYGQLGCSDAGVPYWVETRPDEAGRNVLCCEEGGSVRELTPKKFSVRSKVHEYGGDAWCLLQDEYLFVNAEDQQLYLHSLMGREAPRQLTYYHHSRFLQPIWDKKRNRAIAVEEIHSAGEGASDVINRLVSVDLASGQVSILHEGKGFYAYPALDSAGNNLAFICWDHPEQPWTSTCLYAGKCMGEALVDVAVLAGHKQPEALSQPLYTEDGELWVISDRDEWWNVYRYVTEEQTLRPVVSEKTDMMPSPWVCGPRHFSAYQSGAVYLRHQHEGVTLVVGTTPVILEGVNHIRSLCRTGNKLFAIVAGPKALQGIAEIDLQSISGDGVVSFRKITGGADVLDDGDCSEAVPLSFSSGSERCYGYLYRGVNMQYPRVKSTPLVIFLHGGPTAATYPVLNMKIQYWTQRGFAVLDLNYRGSSIYGRRYRNALHHRWGVSEIEDIQAAVNELIAAGEVDPNAVFIRGNSSGGYTALNAMSDLDCFAAGASLYGVTDPAVLNNATHKFESYYLHWLIGDPVKDSDRYQSYAPINKAQSIRCPVIFFQGELDKVVVPEQTKQMISVLHEQGVETEEYYFADEAHGFRKAENQQLALNSELTFYQRFIK